MVKPVKRGLYEPKVFGATFPLVMHSCDWRGFEVLPRVTSHSLKWFLVARALIPTQLEPLYNLTTRDRASTHTSLPHTLSTQISKADHVAEAEGSRLSPGRPPSRGVAESAQPHQMGEAEAEAGY
jgi:hypothetical protein